MSRRNQVRRQVHFLPDPVPVEVMTTLTSSLCQRDQVQNSCEAATARDAAFCTASYTIHQFSWRERSCSHQGPRESMKMNSLKLKSKQSQLPKRTPLWPWLHRTSLSNGCRSTSTKHNLGIDSLWLADPSPIEASDLNSSPKSPGLDAHPR